MSTPKRHKTLHQTAKEIDLARDLAWNKSEFSIAIDTRDGFAWPWSWYLRDYTSNWYLEDVAQGGVGYISLESEGSEVGDSRTIAVINARNHDNVKETLPEGFGEGRHMIHRWWFPEVYKNKTPVDVWNGFTNRELLRPIADFWFHREVVKRHGLHRLVRLFQGRHTVGSASIMEGGNRRIARL